MLYQRRKYCRTCSNHMLYTRTITRMGCGDLLMVCLTLGGWLVLRMILKPAWRCATCGGK